MALICRELQFPVVDACEFAPQNDLWPIQELLALILGGGRLRMINVTSYTLPGAGTAPIDGFQKFKYELNSTFRGGTLLIWTKHDDALFDEASVLGTVGFILHTMEDLEAEHIRPSLVGH